MLYVIATPIGDKNEITLRALEVIKAVSAVICEGTKETSSLLKHHGISGKKYYLLNEHTSPSELQDLLLLCQQQDVALVSDCGTPGFSDPGPSLIALCRCHDIPIRSVLGASALMGVLSLSQWPVKEFFFKGFLPAENETRLTEIKKLKQTKSAIVLMDTPYRMAKMATEMAEHFPERAVLLVGNLSQEDEFQIQTHGKKLPAMLPMQKAEFMLLIYPQDFN